MKAKLKTITIKTTWYQHSNYLQRLKATRRALLGAIKELDGRIKKAQETKQ